MELVPYLERLVYHRCRALARVVLSDGNGDPPKRHLVRVFIAVESCGNTHTKGGGTLDLIVKEVHTETSIYTITLKTIMHDVYMLVLLG